MLFYEWKAFNAIIFIAIKYYEFVSYVLFYWYLLGVKLFLGMPTKQDLGTS